MGFLSNLSESVLGQIGRAIDAVSDDRGMWVVQIEFNGAQKYVSYTSLEDDLANARRYCTADDAIVEMTALVQQNPHFAEMKFKVIQLS